MIEHGRVRLSPYVRSLRQKLFDWMNDPGVRRAAGEFRTLSELELDRWVERMSTGTQNCFFIIVERERLTPVGFCTLTGLSPIHRHARLGIAIGDAAFRGRGLARDAVTALVRHGYADLGLERIFLDVLADNHAAQRVYEACGFRREGVWRRHFFVDGAFHDAVTMALLHDEAAAEPQDGPPAATA